MEMSAAVRQLQVLVAAAGSQQHVVLFAKFAVLPGTDMEWFHASGRLASASGHCVVLFCWQAPPCMHCWAKRAA